MVRKKLGLYYPDNGYKYYVNNHIKYMNSWLQEILDYIGEYKYMTDDIIPKSRLLDQYVNIIRVHPELKDSSSNKYTIFNLLFLCTNKNVIDSAILYITKFEKDKNFNRLLFTDIITDTKQFKLLFEGLI